MNREQKGVAIAEIAADIEASQAIFAVDYRGISVAQVAELRSKLREAEASFKVVKNSLTERAADQAGAGELKELLSGPTALAFVRGDAAMAAKAIADYARTIQLLPFKGGMMEGEALAAEQIVAISKLPSREVLYGQLVGVVASPVTGLVRTLGALVGGLAIALGQVQQKKESGEIPAGEARSAPAAAAEAPAAEEAAAEAPADEAAEAPAEESAAEAPAAEAAAEAPPEEPAAEAEPEAEQAEEPAMDAGPQDSTDEAEPASEEAAPEDDKDTGASAAEATKED